MGNCCKAASGKKNRAIAPEPEGENLEPSPRVGPKPPLDDKPSPPTVVDEKGTAADAQPGGGRTCKGRKSTGYVRPTDLPPPGADDEEEDFDKDEEVTVKPEEQAAPESAEPPGLALRLAPVKATVQEIAAVFGRYFARLEPRLAKTFDCSWEKLQAEMGGEVGLEWFWILEEGESGVASPEGAAGLIVLKVVKGAFNNHVDVAHFSVAGPSWEERLTPALTAVRASLFLTLPIAGIRVTLWYSEDDEGKFVLDPTVETFFKGGDYRWFTLTNSRDGKRGQVMLLRRNLEKDPAEPVDLVDMSLKVCTFIPVDAAAASEAGDGAAQGAWSPGRVGNWLIIAECLRRHFDTEDLKALSDVAVAEAEPPKEAGTPAEAAGEEATLEKAELPAGEASEEVTPEDLLPPGQAEEVTPEDIVAPAQADADEATKAEEPETKAEAKATVSEVEDPGSRIQYLLTKLADRKNIKEVFFKAVAQGETTVEECEKYCEQVVSGNGVQVSAEVVALLGAWLREQVQFDNVLCGSTGLCGNLQQISLDTDSASQLRLPVRMLGESTHAASPVCYVATEDENTFIIAWQVAKGDEQEVQRSLYSHCHRVLNFDSPSDDGLLFEDVLLPKFRMCCFSPADVEFPPRLASRVRQPCELMAVELSGGRPRPGALTGTPGGRKSCIIEAPFVFCLWHTKLDDLNTPLFATLVKESDCSLDLA